MRSRRRDVASNGNFLPHAQRRGKAPAAETNICFAAALVWRI
jgi:hypothetical protein